ncbi:translation initiation factor IF-3 [Candidatus Peregrinibacteria bacterium]|nr:translation initiation factor IF-3 [Candidatus Peregrinibacteria bacterium]
MSKYFRTNDRIRTPTIRLIDENDEQIGIVAREKGLEMARAKELDLVEVAPNAAPPVCKIMDFGKFLYRQKKQEQKQKKSQKQGEVKGIRLSMRTDTHDLEVKAEKAKMFLKERNLVKVAMILRGRELAHMDLARNKMKVFSDMLLDTGKIEEMPKKQGHNLIMMITPKQ